MNKAEGDVCKTYDCCNYEKYGKVSRFVVAEKAEQHGQIAEQKYCKMYDLRTAGDKDELSEVFLRQRFAQMSFVEVDVVLRKLVLPFWKTNKAVKLHLTFGNAKEASFAVKQTSPDVFGNKHKKPGYAEVQRKPECGVDYYHHQSKQKSSVLLCKM